MIGSILGGDHTPHLYQTSSLLCVIPDDQTKLTKIRGGGQVGYPSWISRGSCDDSICENWKLVDYNTHKSALSARVAYQQDNLQEQLIQSIAKLDTGL